MSLPEQKTAVTLRRVGASRRASVGAGLGVAAASALRPLAAHAVELRFATNPEGWLSGALGASRARWNVLGQQTDDVTRKDSFRRVEGTPNACTIHSCTPSVAARCLRAAAASDSSNVASGAPSCSATTR